MVAFKVSSSVVALLLLSLISLVVSFVVPSLKASSALRTVTPLKTKFVKSQIGSIQRNALFAKAKVPVPDNSQYWQGDWVCAGKTQFCFLRLEKKMW